MKLISKVFWMFHTNDEKPWLVLLALLLVILGCLVQVAG